MLKIGSSIMIEKDLARIRLLSEKKSEENWEFRSFLKRYGGLSSKEIDRLTHSLYNEIASAIDCKECGIKKILRLG